MGRDSEQLSYMYIRTVQLFDQGYIREVGFNETADDLRSISLQSGEIRGMRFALGRFGLRGLRILYADGSMSSWLGSTSGCFFLECSWWKSTGPRGLHRCTCSLISSYQMLICPFISGSGPPYRPH